MKKEAKFTTAQFAKLCGINKKTLHYYDEIGLFSPNYRGENNYRYYDFQQGLDLGLILMLRELDMSIDEIRGYVVNPDSDRFLSLAENKCAEIDRKIRRLEKIKGTLEEKARFIKLGDGLTENIIEIVSIPTEHVYKTEKCFTEYDLGMIFDHLNVVWEHENLRPGCGSFIDTSKFEKGCFDEYDGIYSVALKESELTQEREGGIYIRAYYRGDWEKLPDFYREIIDFADEHEFRLTGYAYEMGINEEVVTSVDDYVCQILIKADKI